MELDLELFFVGGHVRDTLLGLPSKDIDCTVVDPLGFDHMRSELEGAGFEIFKENPEFLTIRAKVPKRLRAEIPCDTADFVLARKDGISTDGRRPDEVTPGTLLDDLRRRDLTVNAIAQTMSGELVDPFNGQVDLANRRLKFVGDAASRIAEDGLRVMRAFRFLITKNLECDSATFDVLVSAASVQMLGCVSVERIDDELNKMMKHDTVASMHLLVKAFKMNANLEGAIFRNELHLTSSLKHV
jgi:tRNA nucleotidyltransferase/poly(A) polymerase